MLHPGASRCLRVFFPGRSPRGVLPGVFFSGGLLPAGAFSEGVVPGFSSTAFSPVLLSFSVFLLLLFRLLLLCFSSSALLSSPALPFPLLSSLLFSFLRLLSSLLFSLLRPLFSFCRLCSSALLSTSSGCSHPPEVRPRRVFASCPALSSSSVCSLPLVLSLRVVSPNPFPCASPSPSFLALAPLPRLWCARRRRAVSGDRNMALICGKSGQFRVSNVGGPG